jgi:hypothetical protein
VAIHAFMQAPLACFVPRNDKAVTTRPLPRHCEARSAVAIHAFMQAPLDCFVPRNDKAGEQ